MRYAVHDYQAFIDEEVRPAHQADIPGALKRAYGAADALMNDVSFLKTEGGKFARGHLIQHSVDHQIVKLIQTGAWPFDFYWDWHAKPTGKHLKVLPRRTVITISQLQLQTQFPRHAWYRDNQRLNNNPRQFDLFEDQKSRLLDTRERPHLILTHGYQNLSFASICIPHSRRVIWSYEGANLLTKLWQIESDLPPVEVPRSPVNPELTDELKEWLRKNDEQDKRD